MKIQRVFVLVAVSFFMSAQGFSKVLVECYLSHALTSGGQTPSYGRISGTSVYLDPDNYFLGDEIRHSGFDYRFWGNSAKVALRPNPGELHIDVIYDHDSGHEKHLGILKPLELIGHSAKKKIESNPHVKANDKIRAECQTITEIELLVRSSNLMDFFHPFQRKLSNVIFGQLLSYLGPNLAFVRFWVWLPRGQ